MAKTVRIFNYREIKNEDYVSHRVLLMTACLQIYCKIIRINLLKNARM